MPDLNVKNVPATTMRRLTEQATREGMSLSEWVRQALEARARLATPAELSALHADEQRSAPMDADAFDAWQNAQIRRRTA